MELTKTEGVGLEVLETDQTIDGELAWNLAQLIADAEDNIQLAKGKFWNRCERGTREEICDHFGWRYKTMADYAMFAKEMVDFEQVRNITYNHYLKLRVGGISKDSRPAWLQRASDNEWTPKQLTDAIKKETKTDDTEIPIAETEEFKESLENSLNGDTEDTGSRSTTSTAARLTKKVSVGEAKRMFGIDPLTQETIDVLYKHLSKKYHPDKGGSTEAFNTLGECKERLEKTL